MSRKPRLQQTTNRDRCLLRCVADASEHVIEQWSGALAIRTRKRVTIRERERLSENTNEVFGDGDGLLSDVFQEILLETRVPFSSIRLGLDHP